MKLHLDFETRSRADLTKVGAWAYASHPSTEILCMGWAINDEIPRVLKRGDVPRVPLAIPQNAHVVAHNYQFEYAIYHFILHKRYGWPALLDPERWDCTMARAYTCGLPGSLEGASLALNLPLKKDLEGYRVMMKLCKPQLDGTFNEDPALFETLYRYNALDVEVERALDKALPEMTPIERKIFEADLVMNRRGIGIDIRSATYARDVAGVIVDDLNAELRKLTKGAVSGATKLPSLKRWVEAQGVTIPTKTVVKKDEDGVLTEEEKETLDAEAVSDLVRQPAVPDIVKRVLRIRGAAGKSSVTKYNAMLTMACGDGRVRGAFQYHGAHTGRWAGRGIQPQNFPKGCKVAEQEGIISLLGDGAGFFAAVHGERSMHALANALRGMLIPAPGKVFVCADFNAIEARVVFWLANQVEALNQYAAGKSPYITMASRIFDLQGIAKETHPFQYDIGKRSVLGCGFGMGWIRFQANVYTETAKQSGEGVWIEDDLSQRAVYGYRKEYPRVVNLWYAMESAAVRAVLNPGQIFDVADGKVAWKMSKDRQFLVCKLPSGRLLRYFRPSVRAEESRKGVKNNLYYWTSAGSGAIKTEANGKLGWYRTWGGELVENVVQAVARDFVAGGMLNVEAAGYPLVLTAHDELMAEIIPSSLKVIAKEAWEKTIVADFIEKMTRVPDWGRGCPIAAEGWVGRRYRK